MSDERTEELADEFGSRLTDMSQDKLDELSEFLRSEIQVVRENEERQAMFTMWDEWRRQREAKPRNQTKNEPWPGASNVVVPVTLANTNGMYARTKAHVRAKSPVVSGKSTSKKYVKHAEVAADILNYLNNSPFHVNLPAKEHSMLYDWISLGTQVMEWEWVTKTVRIRRDGTFVDKVLKKGPELNVHALEDVLVRANAGDDVQKLPWIGFLRRFYGHELMTLGQNGFFDPDEVELVLGSPVTEATSDNRLNAQSREGLEPRYTESSERSSLYDVVKAYVWFDADEDGTLEDLIVWIEPSEGRILRIDYNPAGMRFVTTGRFLPTPQSFYGTGLGKLVYDMQEEIDTFHNLRINTQMMHASGGIIRRKGAELFNKSKQVKPGFEFEAEDPRADYVLWQFPDVTPSTLTGENQARNYIDLAMGTSDSFFGRGDNVAKSGTSFSLQNFQAGRTDSILESMLESVVEGYNDLFQKELMLLLLYGESLSVMLEEFYDPETESQKFEVLQELLTWDPEDIPSRITFAIQTTDLARSEEAKRQTAMLRFQVYTMVFDKMTQIIPALSQGEVDDETKRLLINGIVGYHDMLREIMELSGSENIDDALLDVELYRTLGKIMDDMSRGQSEQLRSGYERERAGQGLDGGEQAELGNAPMGPQGAGELGGQGAPPDGGGQGPGPMGIA